MRTNMKKLAACILALLLVIQMVPAMADEQAEGTFHMGDVLFRDKLEIKAETSIINVGQTIQLTWTEHYDNLTWKSSSDEVATVNQNGEVTAVASGTVKITASETGDNNQVYSDSIKLRVVGSASADEENEQTEMTETTDTPVAKIIVINANKDKVVYDGKVHTTGYNAESNIPGFDQTKVQMINPAHEVKATDCNVYTTQYEPADFSYEGMDDVEFIVSDGWLQIKPASVIVAAEDKTIREGETNPRFTATVSGLLNGEDSSFIKYKFKTEEQADGSTAIVPYGDALQSNYRVSYANGTLTTLKKQPLYNILKIGNDYYRLAKTNIWTNRAISKPNFGQSIPEGEYEVDGYDFSDLIVTYNKKEYVYGCSKNAAAIADGANYYSVKLDCIKIIYNKIGALDKKGNPRWIVPEDQQYNDPNNTDSIHRDYIIEFHDGNAASKQDLYNMLFIGNRDSDHYRLKKSTIIAPPIENYGNKVKELKANEYILTDYDFNNVVIVIDGEEYKYSDHELDGEYDNYFTVKFDRVITQTRINGNQDWYDNDEGWLDGSKEQYGNQTDNNTIGYHANYQAFLHKGNRTEEDSSLKVYIVSNWPEGKPAYIGTKITLTAKLIGFEGKKYTLQWKYSTDLNEWFDEPGATEATFTYVLDETTARYTWKVVATEVKE